MTDITELAQREKFEAWARSQQLSIAYGDCGYVYSSTEMAWRAVKALSAELVEALEKAQTINAAQDDHINQQQDRIDQLEKGHQEAAKQINSWRRMAKQNIAEREKDIAELDAARQRIAELETRTVTVKLPPAVSVADWMVDIDVYEADLLRALLTAAGIKVEAE
ncbi:TPA: hypothetical protein ACTYOT_003244 [Raoultella ornithinolytica]|uniref:hypothetical protein n=1 Tax=Raoultella ornithinolytica TaxID=54291 RepID=UPI0039B512C4